MTKHEQLPSSTLNFEPADTLQLKAAYDLLRNAVSGHQELTPSPTLTESVQHSSATPFNTIDAASLDTLPAEYDPENNTVYPEILTFQVHGFYGDIDANERSLVYTLAHDPVENTYSGFVLQAFHDSESYPLESSHSLSEFAHTVAAHHDEYTTTLDHEQFKFSTGDFKRTTELRALDASDLDTFAIAVAQQATAA